MLFVVVGLVGRYKEVPEQKVVRSRDLYKKKSLTIATSSTYIQSSDMDPDTLPSRIATLVHEHFDALPPRSKPTIHPDGSREWIPMTGIVVVKGTS